MFIVSEILMKKPALVDANDHGRKVLLYTKIYPTLYFPIYILVIYGMWWIINHYFLGRKNSSQVVILCISLVLNTLLKLTYCVYFRC